MGNKYKSFFLRAGFFRLLILFLMFFCASGEFLFAQTVRNVKAFIRDGRVEVRYDLIAPDRSYEFSIELYGSNNNYTTPLKQVQGDVGKKIAAGEGKIIIWNPKGELVNFKGEVQFEVRAKAAALAPPISILSPEGGSKIKVGSNIKVTWQGGDPAEQLKLQLVQGVKLVSDFGAFSNNGSAEIPLEKNIVPGEYQLKLIAYEGEVFSKSFVIKKKSSPLLKIIPVAVLLGGGAAVLMGGGGSSSGKELPVAPEPN